ncbi:hypothetical protein HNQ92_004568 [Rhabdobacter roseus]|uniref:Uncharacterized protein n=1 Tax=Rhabdobacter roseus TaxID=1655419 RepID=A0A840U216_9BACT|nr:hypothetical protein [Rhabdobacter roseus]MBB5286408.1 hypothetical protein [Rhabdobacter roseus]
MKQPTLLALFLLSILSAHSQTKKETASEAQSDQVPLHLDKANKVWLMTYFRQRYPTRNTSISSG